MWEQKIRRGVSHRELLIGQPHSQHADDEAIPWLMSEVEDVVSLLGSQKIFASRTCSCVNFERATFLIRRQIFSVQKFARSRRKFPRIRWFAVLGHLGGLILPPFRYHLHMGSYRFSHCRSYQAVVIVLLTTSFLFNLLISLGVRTHLIY